MKISRTILLLLGCLLVELALGQKDEKPFEYPCEQEAMLFAPHRTAPVLDARSPALVRNRIDSLGRLEDQDKCGKMMEHGIILKDGRKVRVNIKRQCKLGPIACFLTYEPFSVKMNRKGQVLADHHVVGSIDSLSNKVKKGIEYAHSKGDKVRVQVFFSDRVPQDRLNKALQEVVEGYRNWYQKASKGRDLCELDPFAIRNLQQVMPFEIMLMSPLSTTSDIGDSLSIGDMNVNPDPRFDFEGKEAEEDEKDSCRAGVDSLIRNLNRTPDSLMEMDPLCFFKLVEEVGDRLKGGDSSYFEELSMIARNSDGYAATATMTPVQDVFESVPGQFLHYISKQEPQTSRLRALVSQGYSMEVSTSSKGEEKRKEIKDFFDRLLKKEGLSEQERKIAEEIREDIDADQ